MINGLDISHWQGQPDMGAIKRAGYDFIVLKATEGTYYQDPDFHVNRDNARAAGLIVLAYHFARNGDPVAEANYFLDFVGAFQHGEGYDLDWEVPGDAPTFTLAFLTQCKARTGFNGGVYLNNYYLTNFDWTKVKASNFSLWYARYNDTANDSPGTWLCSMKQYTSTGSVPGVNGPVDKDVFYGDEAQLTSMGFQGKQPAPTPIPPAPPKPKPATNPVYHTVVSGDTVTAIANANHVSVAQIVAWNHLANPNLIYPRQRLIVGYSNSPTPIVHTVRPGETVTLIAKNNGVSVAQIVGWNHLANPNLIYPNQHLIVGYR